MTSPRGRHGMSPVFGGEVGVGVVVAERIRVQTGEMGSNLSRKDVCEWWGVNGAPHRQ